MKKFILQDNGTADTIEIKYQLRQYGWKKTENCLKVLAKIKKIHTPWAHTKNQVDMFNDNKEAFLENCNHFSRKVLNLKKGDLVAVEHDGKGLIVELDSDIKSGVIKEQLVVRKERSCNHNFTHQGHDVGDEKGCEKCDESVVKLICSDDLTSIQKYLEKGYILEPFYSPYFDIKVLGFVDYNGKRNSVAGQCSFNNLKKNTHFKVEELNNPFDFMI